jgi:hypothetical protein
MSRKFKETALLKEGSQVSSHAAAAQTQSSVELAPTERVGLRRQDWLLSLLLVILTMVAYLPAWNGTPIWDDDAHLTKPELRSLEGLARIWTSTRRYPTILSIGAFALLGGTPTLG